MGNCYLFENEDRLLSKVKLKTGLQLNSNIFIVKLNKYSKTVPTINQIFKRTEKNMNRGDLQFLSIKIY